MTHVFGLLCHYFFVIKKKAQFSVESYVSLKFCSASWLLSIIMNIHTALGSFFGPSAILTWVSAVVFYYLLVLFLFVSFLFLFCSFSCEHLNVGNRHSVLLYVYGRFDFMYVCATHSCNAPRRGYWIPWNMECPVGAGKQTRVLWKSIQCLNHGAIFPAPTT